MRVPEKIEKGCGQVGGGYDEIRESENRELYLAFQRVESLWSFGFDYGYEDGYENFYF